MITTFILGAILLYPIFSALYNITLHPLASYPGPKLWAAFQFPYVYHVLRGRQPERISQLHDKYGPVVRISSTELSFISAQSWRDIYNTRNPQLPKDVKTYVPPDEYEGKRMVMEMSDTKHKAARDQLSHAFAPRALLEHQPLITGYIDQLISSVRAKVTENKPLDIAAYFNWTTFDIIGHLTFGESFHCLDTLSYHPWIKVIFDGVAMGQKLNQLDRYGLLRPLLKIIPKSAMKPRMEMVEFSNARMDARLKLGFGPGTRKDFVYFMHHGPHGEKSNVPEITNRDHLCANGETLVVAGSETTATLLSGLMFLLLTKRPDYLDLIKREVRTAFPNDDTIDSINFRSVTEKLPLLIAALKETLRIYPAAPFGFARLVLNTSKIIDSHVVPPNTSVSISQYAAHRSSQNFHRPEDFSPERWFDDALLPGSPFERDQRDAYQPFSFGPRSCLGKPLAEIESRLIFAKMVWNFDFELCAGQDGWMRDQTISLMMGKGPLMVKFRDVRALKECVPSHVGT